MRTLFHSNARGPISIRTHEDPFPWGSISITIHESPCPIGTIRVSFHEDQFPFWPLWVHQDPCLCGSTRNHFHSDLWGPVSIWVHEDHFPWRSMPIRTDVDPFPRDPCSWREKSWGVKILVLLVRGPILSEQCVQMGTKVCSSENKNVFKSQQKRVRTLEASTKSCARLQKSWNACGFFDSTWTQTYVGTRK